MRRADRLFQIVQILRRQHGPVTASAIAVELETSQRSVYRDIAALIGQRVPVRGEAGVGYVLEDGFDLPPLMLTADEVEAAALGAQWVVGHGDPALATAARDLLAKITAVLPPEMRPLVDGAAARTAPGWRIAPDSADAAQLRACIRAGRKLALTYRAENNTISERTVWPALVAYLDAARILVAWCELRQDFRSFRLDRIVMATPLDARYPSRPAILRAQYLASFGKT